MLILLMGGALLAGVTGQPQRGPDGRWIICPGPHPRCREAVQPPAPQMQTCPDGSLVSADQPCSVGMAAIPGPFIVFFDADSTRLNPSAAPILDQAVAAYHAAGGVLSLALSASTDRTGAAAVNIARSQRYADAVRAYLVAHGVPETKITAAVYGEARPAVQTPDGVREPLNRRVEITLGPAAPGR